MALLLLAGAAVYFWGGGCDGKEAGKGAGDKPGGVAAVVNLVDRGVNLVRDAPTRVEPPVDLSLQPFLFLRGYYLTVGNTSADTTLTGVTVTYVGASGNTVTQTVGDLPPRRAVRLDPSAVGWTVERNERVRVSASGYLTKVVDTNLLIR